MELTRMRHWVTTHLLYEYLFALPEDAEHEEELISIRLYGKKVGKLVAA
jgi:hypothetical protein